MAGLILPLLFAIVVSPIFAVVWILWWLIADLLEGDDQRARRRLDETSPEPR